MSELIIFYLDVGYVLFGVCVFITIVTTLILLLSWVVEYIKSRLNKTDMQVPFTKQTIQEYKDNLDPRATIEMDVINSVFILFFLGVCLSFLILLFWPIAICWGLMEGVLRAIEFCRHFKGKKIIKL